MSASLVLQQYWQLIRTLILPLRFIRWLVMGVLVLAVLGGVLIGWLDEPVLLILSTAIATTLGMVFCIMLPSQMLSLASSKQLSWIPGLRIKTLAILFGMYNLMVLLVCMFILNTMGTARVANYAAMVFSVAALVASIILVSGVYCRRYQPLIFIAIWAAVFGAGQLQQVNPLIIFTSGVAIWVILSVWWIRWVPQSYLRNYMTVASDQMRDVYDRHEAGEQPLLMWFSSAPRSLCGTLLMGSSDGIGTLLKRELLQLVVVAISAAWLIYFVGQQHGALPILLPSLLLFTLQQNYFVVQGFYYRNLARVWMWYEGTRRDLFRYIEKRFCGYLVVSAAIWGCLILMANRLMFDAALPHSLFLFVILSGMLFSATLFYIGWIIYARSGANMRLLNWIAAGFCLVFLPLMAAVCFMWVKDAEQHANASSHYWLLILVMMAVMLFVRSWALRGWSRINFCRVKN